MELLVRGNFWRATTGYMAEIPSLRLLTNGASIDECLSNMKSLLEDYPSQHQTEYSIELIGGNCFHVKSTNTSAFSEFISMKIAEALSRS